MRGSHWELFLKFFLSSFSEVILKFLGDQKRRCIKCYDDWVHTEYNLHSWLFNLQREAFGRRLQFRFSSDAERQARVLESLGQANWTLSWRASGVLLMNRSSQDLHREIFSNLENFTEMSTDYSQLKQYDGISIGHFDVPSLETLWKSYESPKKLSKSFCKRILVNLCWSNF